MFVCFFVPRQGGCKHGGLFGGLGPGRDLLLGFSGKRVCLSWLFPFPRSGNVCLALSVPGSRGGIISGPSPAGAQESVQVNLVLSSSGFLTRGDMSLRTKSSLRSWALGCLGRCPFWVCCPQAGPGRDPSSCGCVSLILTLPPSSTDFFLPFISLGHLALWFLILCVYLFVPSSPLPG